MIRRLSSYSPLVILPLATIVLTLSGCYNVPVTGRNSVSLVDDKDINAKAAAEFEQVKKMHKLSRNPAQIKIVNHIGSRLSKTVFWDVPLAEWEFVVFQAPTTLNAFAMPGGKVAVFSGLIDFCENEDQLASVIAHEIAHVAARHTHERFSQGMLLSPLGAATSIGVGGAISGVGVYMPSVGSAVGGVTTAATQLAFDRGKELEADHIGLMYMAKAGYDPREAMKLLEKMEEREASSGAVGPPGWMANHPGFPQRQIQLMELMPEAIKIYENGETGATHTIIE
ncbi:M48 family metallopeptidase [Synoicihabitans lomoniglobus]|uniref:M48 family metallopeptidase n=1 Tax=Synoicihabitans lomoniglobus TaxID=2909285 RepID=A0AAE9ZXC6_9BACT|nr:M48 family metallopeptidase [Opitutaceae bacterium LMO-M01]WED65231.1 M48 family metallopeptidase [Opitutaceae bacterium LMO-M01]